MSDKKNNKSGKVLLVVLVILFLIGGGLSATYFLMASGRIQAPPQIARFLPKQKAKPKEAPKVDVQAKAPARRTPPPAVQVKATRTNPITNNREQGDRRLAKLWNDVETNRLLEITANWEEAELASILSKMSREKVAEMLTAMDADRASRLSRAIRQEAIRSATTETPN